MIYVCTFLATGMNGAICEEYVWYGEYIGANPTGMWHFYSDDIDGINVINKYKYGAEDRIKKIISDIWANSNVYVSVKKTASTVVNHASK